MSTRFPLVCSLVAAAALAAASCSTSGEGPPSSPTPPEAASGEPLEAPVDPAALMALGEEHGIHNFAHVGKGVYRGAQPGGEASFALMARLGIRTALSVDGGRPDVEAAARHGIRYVHVPLEYSGVTPDQQARISKAALLFEGPMYVHCHHGKHRGPAASSIAWLARGGEPVSEAVEDMKRAGTSPKYAGLYEDVRNFKGCPDEVLAALTEADLPSVAPTPPLVDAMVSVDDSFARMKAVRGAGWKTPPAHPDVRPAHEARILAEYFRELARTEEVKGRPEDFRKWLEESEQAAWDLEKALEAGDAAAAAEALDRVDTTCNSCHNVYRNRKRTW